MSEHVDVDVIRARTEAYLGLNLDESRALLDALAAARAEVERWRDAHGAAMELWRHASKGWADTATDLGSARACALPRRHIIPDNLRALLAAPTGTETGT